MATAPLPTLLWPLPPSQTDPAHPWLWRHLLSPQQYYSCALIGYSENY